MTAINAQRMAMNLPCDAQAPGGAAAGKEHVTAILQGAQHGLFDGLRLAGIGELPVLAHVVPVGLEQQAQGRADVALGGFTEVGGDRVGGFGRQDAELELVADLEEFFGTPVGCFAHGGAVCV